MVIVLVKGIVIFKLFYRAYINLVINVDFFAYGCLNFVLIMRDHLSLAWLGSSKLLMIAKDSSNCFSKWEALYHS